MMAAFPGRKCIYSTQPPLTACRRKSSLHDVITDQPVVQHVDFNFGRVHMSLALVHRSRCCLCVLYIKLGLWVCQICHVIGSYHNKTQAIVLCQIMLIVNRVLLNPQKIVPSVQLSACGGTCDKGRRRQVKRQLSQRSIATSQMCGNSKLVCLGYTEINDRRCKAQRDIFIIMTKANLNSVRASMHRPRCSDIISSYR